MASLVPPVTSMSRRCGCCGPCSGASSVAAYGKKKESTVSSELSPPHWAIACVSVPPDSATQDFSPTLTFVVSCFCVGGMKPGRLMTVLRAGLTKGAEFTVRDTSCTGAAGAGGAGAAEAAAPAFPPPRLRLDGEAGAAAAAATAGGWLWCMVVVAVGGDVRM